MLPQTIVSSTITFAGIDSLSGQLRDLNGQLDFISITYAPLSPNFTVLEPAAAKHDFQRMKSVAGKRKIMLQEIGYPTADATGGSEDKQAEFYRLVFQQIDQDPDAFIALNFMYLADLSRQSARQFATFYGLHTPAFEGVLQSMGLFNEAGQAKKAWRVLEAELSRGASR